LHFGDGVVDVVEEHLRDTGAAPGRVGAELGQPAVVGLDAGEPAVVVLLSRRLVRREQS
jgi:hypothetical protein